MAKHRGKRERLARKAPKKRRGRVSTHGEETWRKLGRKKFSEFLRKGNIPF